MQYPRNTLRLRHFPVSINSVSHYYQAVTFLSTQNLEMGSVDVFRWVWYFSWFQTVTTCTCFPKAHHHPEDTVREAGNQVNKEVVSGWSPGHKDVLTRYKPTLDCPLTLHGWELTCFFFLQTVLHVISPRTKASFEKLGQMLPSGWCFVVNPVIPCNPKEKNHN